ncbi:MAG: PAS domain-containing protein, partial [Duganella sp.]
MPHTDSSEYFQGALQPLLVTTISQLENPAMITDDAGKIVWVNHAFCQLTGYSMDGLLGRSPSILQSGHQDAAFYSGLWQPIQAGQVW